MNTSNEVQLMADKLVKLFTTWPRENNLSPEMVKSFDDVAESVKKDPAGSVELLAKWEHLSNLRKA